MRPQIRGAGPPAPITSRHRFLTWLLIGASLGGCAQKLIPPDISYDEFVPAAQTADPPAPVQVVELPKPLPLPGQPGEQGCTRAARP